MRISQRPALARLMIVGLAAMSLLGGQASARTTVNTQSIDAHNGQVWIYFNLTSHSQVTPATPETSLDWDLAFQRHRIKSNGGDSGKGGVSVTWLDAQDFDALKTAPSPSRSTYVVDSNAPTGNTIGDRHLAFLGSDGWYTYSDTHKLGAKNRVYVVKTTGGKYVKLQMLGYYSDAGTSGNPKFRYAEIDPPAN